MKRMNILLAVLMVAVLCGGAVYWAAGARTPTKQIQAVGRRYDVTPTDKMRVRTAEGQPHIDPADFRLKVKGLVERPQSLTLQELQRLPAVERYVQLPCVEGWTEAGVWKGPRLSTVLEAAGVKKGATTVIFRSPGGYSTSLTLKDVGQTDPLLAYGVNGGNLPEAQGYPLRLVAPDRLGYKWIKWVTEIELVSGDYRGYWESRGYSNEAGAGGR